MLGEVRCMNAELADVNHNQNKWMGGKKKKRERESTMFCSYLPELLGLEGFLEEKVKRWVSIAGWQ